MNESTLRGCDVQEPLNFFFQSLSFVYLNILPFVLILSLLVFVHELGHYLVARYNGVRVEVFSIGFGPEIFGWTDRSGTRWKVSYVPLGGYVKMFSDLNAASQPDAAAISHMSDADKAVSLFHKSVGQRLAVSIAGPVANYLLAILLLTGLYITVGQRIPAETAKIGHIMDQSAAFKAGLKTGDHVIAINDQPVKTFIDMQAHIKANPDKKLVFRIERAEQQHILDIIPTAQDTLNGRVGLIGVTQGTDTHVLPFYQAPMQAVIDVVKISYQTLSSLGRMLTGKQSADGLSGPLGIASLTSQAAQAGITETVWLTALLSISLGFLNLLPVPMLDGGHLLFYCIEAIRGKPVRESIQEVGYKIGFGLIVALMLFSTWNDLTRHHFFQNIFSALKSILH